MRWEKGPEQSYHLSTGRPWASAELPPLQGPLKRSLCFSCDEGDLLVHVYNGPLTLLTFRLTPSLQENQGDRQMSKVGELLLPVPPKTDPEGGLGEGGIGG